MRGKHRSPSLTPGIRRSIPAHAGETSKYLYSTHYIKVYPRPCGGNVACAQDEDIGNGLSPPMRGKRSLARALQQPEGSIPAHAGETTASRSRSPTGTVYPRPCGGNRRSGPSGTGTGGLSPPMRGKLVRVHDHPPGRRSIPAHAGETAPRSPRTITRSVYPRPCGGNCPFAPIVLATHGLSPPMRGKLTLPASSRRYAGSIPAHAGETGAACAICNPSRVYPRPCGGNNGLSPRLSQVRGLSPPMRGKLVTQVGGYARAGSIPAHAGETRVRSRPPSAAGVYPRPCGGNMTAPTQPSLLLGLSPPMRGKLVMGGPLILITRSIPAHAGETPCRVVRLSPTAVYPRPCGGNFVVLHPEEIMEGLSPPMRGKRPALDPHHVGNRSIPAHAGETPTTTSWASGTQVYPRPCGGNGPVPACVCFIHGLSPPMRGKLALFQRQPLHYRSIPAHAGETYQADQPGPQLPVYPRPCGGNTLTLDDPPANLGLSPPMRGKRNPSAAKDRGNRSIPAHAGETVGGLVDALWARVYPRPCGGNASGSVLR